MRRRTSSSKETMNIRVSYDLTLDDMRELDAAARELERQLRGRPDIYTVSFANYLEMKCIFVHGLSRRYIPQGYDAILSEYQGYPVVFAEAIYEPCVGRGEPYDVGRIYKDLLQKKRIGGMISFGGTLGGVVRRENNLYGVTCRHVVVSEHNEPDAETQIWNPDKECLYGMLKCLLKDFYDFELDDDSNQNLTWWNYVHVEEEGNIFINTTNDLKKFIEDNILLTGQEPSTVDLSCAIQVVEDMFRQTNEIQLNDLAVLHQYGDSSSRLRNLFLACRCLDVEPQRIGVFKTNESLGGNYQGTYVDCALVQLDQGIVNDNLQEIQPLLEHELHYGLDIEKYGWRTGKTTGKLVRMLWKDDDGIETAETHVNGSIKALFRNEWEAARLSINLKFSQDWRFKGEKCTIGINGMSQTVFCCGQYLLYSRGGFGEHGDSGSLVYAKDASGQKRVLGLLHGNLSGDLPICMVCPITAILDHFQCHVIGSTGSSD